MTVLTLFVLLAGVDAGDPELANIRRCYELPAIIDDAALDATVAAMIEDDSRPSGYRFACGERLGKWSEKLGETRVIGSVLRVGLDSRQKQELRVAALDRVTSILDVDKNTALLDTATHEANTIVRARAVQLMLRSKTSKKKELLESLKPAVEGAVRWYSRDFMERRDGAEDERDKAVMSAQGALCAAAPAVDPSGCRAALSLFLMETCSERTSPRSSDEVLSALRGLAAVLSDEDLKKPLLGQCGFTNQKRNPALTLWEGIRAGGDPPSAAETELAILMDRFPNDAEVRRELKARLRGENTAVVVSTLALLSESRHKKEWRKAFSVQLSQLKDDRTPEVAEAARAVMR